ncbi:hypothetical protein CYG49_01945 [Candidatus Saccharibacteria bacterium]|nr:MAG: hypothetical protein CYG49_01945 [Candidatus Saccharibacteria bacterium]
MKSPVFALRAIAVVTVFAVAANFNSVTTVGAQGQREAAQQEKEQRNAEREQSKQEQRAQKTEEKQQRAEEKQQRAEEKQQQKAVKLEEKQLKACEKREAAIQRKMTQIADRSERQLAVFTKISERTQAFYKEKGRTVANYDALIMELEAKKIDAETAVEAVRSSSTTFTCEGEDPKGVVAGFKESLQTQNMVLKEYKTAVKNLIVAVKSAQSTAKNSDDTTDTKTENESSETTGDQE